MLIKPLGIRLRKQNKSYYPAPSHEYFLIGRRLYCPLCKVSELSIIFRLKKFFEIPSDINSIESWIEGAKKLIKSDQNQRAYQFSQQASFLSPIENNEGGFNAHHNNAEIYYYSAINNFNIGEDYGEAGLLFKKAYDLDQNFKIPKDITQKFEAYDANRKGKNVEIIVPLDISNLKTVIPSKDIILCSTSAKATCANKASSTSNKKSFYEWNTHLLLSLNGIAMNVAMQVSQTQPHYVPWGLTSWRKPRRGRWIWVYSEAGYFMSYIILDIIPNKEIEHKNRFAYIDRFKPILEERIIEMEKKIEDNLKSAADRLSF
ncbi:hypothetical protein LCGC14_2954620, partial [marine sediment metagenome]